jgi:small GTP-binding protein
MDTQDSHITIKIIIIGDSGVGKTSIIESYTRQELNPHPASTIGVDFFIKYLTIDDLNVKVVVWDTAGQEKYRAINRSYHRGSDAVLMVFDLGTQSSFDNLCHWLDQITKHAPSEKFLKILVGNKTDDKVVVDDDQIDKFLESHPDFTYFVTSAIKNQNIELLFDRCIRDCIKTKSYQVINRNKIELKKEPNLDECCKN